MDKKEASAKTAALLKELDSVIAEKLGEVQKICDEAQIEVYWAPTGYGSGATYIPNKPEGWEGSDTYGYYDDPHGRWVSSSEEC